MNRNCIVYLIGCLVFAVVSYAQELNEIGFYNSPDQANGADVSGDFMYVSDYEGGLRIVDISDMENPREVEWFDVGGGVAYKLDVVGDIVYIAAAEAGLIILNVENPRDPEVMGIYDSPGRVRDVKVAGDLAFIADNYAGFKVIDVSDPENPHLLGSCQTADAALDLWVAGNIVYVADHGGGLRVIDVSNPEDPDEIGAYNTPGHAYGVAASGDFAYVADYERGICIVDVSDPDNPRFRATYNMANYVTGIFADRGYLYVSDYDNGLIMLDASDGDDPEQVDVYNTPGQALDVNVVGNMAYVADRFGGVRLVRILGLGMCVSPDRLDFGDVGLQHDEELVLTVTNNGEEEVEILNISIEGDYFHEEFEDVEFLAPDEELEIIVTFSPDEFGEFSGVLTVSSDDAENEEIEVILTGNGIGAIINALPDAIDFEDVGINDEALTAIRISNRGLNDLIISQMETAGEYFSVAFENEVALEPNDHLDFLLSFRPDACRQFEDVLTIHSNDAEHPVLEIPLEGSGLGPVIRVVPDDIDFHEVGINLEVNDDIRITNRGLNDLIISSMVIEGEYFSVNFEEEFTLEPQDHRNFTISFRPDDYGEFEAILLIHSNDPDHPVLEIPLAGEGQGPEIDLNVALMNFHDVGIESEESMDLRIRNRGLNDLVIEDIVVEGEYFSVGFDEEFVVEPNHTQEVEVFFAPRTTGEHDGLLTITSNDPGNRQVEVDLTGEGVGAIIAVTPDEINFDRVSVGLFAEDDVTLRNTGLSNLIITGVESDNENFYAIFDEEVVIEPNASYHMDIRFAPVGDGEMEGAISIFSNDQDENVASVTVTGLGFRGLCYELPDCAYGVEIVNQTAFVANERSGLQILDVSDPYHPWEISDYNTPGQSYEVCVRDEFAFIADGSNGLCIVNISELDDPVLVSRYNTGGHAFDVVVLGDYAWVADGEEGIRIIDIFDPERLVEVASFETPGEARGLFLVNTTLYVADNVSGLRILDISDPEEPQEIGSFNTRGFAWDVYVHEDIAYVADERRGLRLINVADPGNPAEVGCFETENNVYGVSCQNDIAYIVDGVGGLKLIDVSDLDNISLIDAFMSPDMAMSVCVNGYYAYVGTSEIGMIIYNLSEHINHPVISLEQQEINFGAVETGFEGELAVTISNVGTEALVVSQLGVEGECFDVMFENPVRIEPDGSYDLPIIFCPSDPIEYEGTLTICSDSPGCERQCVTMQGTGTLRQLVVSMARGWNLISINVSPTGEFYLNMEDRGPDVVLMTEQLRIDEDNSHLLIFKDDNGSFYAPRFNFNNIPYWNLAKGYQVKVDADVEAVWEGDRIPADADIQLVQGWNTIAYFPDYELDASAPDFFVLSSILDQLLYAKDMDALFMTPRYNYSNMHPWRETQGYKVAVSEDVVLNYPELRQGGELAGVSSKGSGGNGDGNHTGEINPGRENHWTAIEPTGVNMCLLVTGSEKYFESGDQIAAVTPDGFFVATGFLDDDRRCGLAVWGDDASTSASEGLREGEAFELILWDADRRSERHLVSEIIEGDGLIFQIDGFSVAAVTPAVETVEEFELSNCYPNPFNSVTRINFGLPEASSVRIAVFDSNGRMVESLTDQHYSAGRHSATWDAQGMSAGVYVVEIIAGQVRDSRKVVLLR